MKRYEKIRVRPKIVSKASSLMSEMVVPKGSGGESKKAVVGILFMLVLIVAIFAFMWGYESNR